MKSLLSFIKWSLLGGVALITSSASVVGLSELMDGKQDNYAIALGFFFIGGALFIGIIAVILKSMSSNLINLGASNKSLLLKGEKLKEYANELGVSTTKLHNTNGLLNEPELQKRVLAAESHIREHKLRLLAVMSAIAAVISAIAAIISIWL